LVAPRAGQGDWFDARRFDDAAATFGTVVEEDPADHYALYLWGHSWSWHPGYTMQDDGSRNSLNPHEIAAVLPFADAVFDLACSAYGAVPFAADTGQIMREVHRVLRPGGRWVFSVTHPVRWAFPDEPGPEGLTASSSYFDRTPYVEEDEQGRAVYVEHHRTLGDRVRELNAAGFRLVDLVEPEWPADLTQEWGGWSPLRGRHLPGTAVFVCLRD